MKRLLGLYREKQYSPGRHQSNDARILELIAQQLREQDCAVELFTLEEAEPHQADAALVFSMCQGKASLAQLAEWEKNGARIINRPEAALNTHRDRLPALMMNSGLAFPPTELVDTSRAFFRSLDLNGGIWLKRGDVHASVAADVQWIDSPQQLDAGLADFSNRGINRAVVQAHRPGDEIKFYGVGRGSFFHWFYSGAAQEYPFALADLETLARQAAAAAGLDIFGGDVIVSPGGELTLIDLNDWPSFAPCREAASHAIAEFIMQRLHAH